VFFRTGTVLLRQWKGTGLHRASTFGFPEIVTLLLQHGADPAFKDKVCCSCCSTKAASIYFLRFGMNLWYLFCLLKDGNTARDKAKDNNVRAAFDAFGELNIQSNSIHWVYM
jgi:ankyrin repeat protein